MTIESLVRPLMSFFTYTKSPLRHERILAKIHQTKQGKNNVGLDKIYMI